MPTRAPHCGQRREQARPRLGSSRAVPSEVPRAARAPVLRRAGVSSQSLLSHQQQKRAWGSSCPGAAERNPTRNDEGSASSAGLTQGLPTRRCRERWGGRQRQLHLSPQRGPPRTEKAPRRHWLQVCAWEGAATPRASQNRASVSQQRRLGGDARRRARS